MIPFLDLNAQYITIKDEIDTAIKECISGSNFIKGEAVSSFEKNFANYLGIKYSSGCGNGTDALEIILASLNIGQGDEVIVPALTWIATAEAVNNSGAEPVFVDVDSSTYSIDFRKIEEKITKRTKAIITVHLYGFPASMDEILAIASKYKLHVIEDCAQAHGAVYKGRKVGTFGIASAFSFFPSKNLGAFGDGGAIVTNDNEIIERCRKISNHGQLNEKHKHFVVGRNSRLDGLQASILQVKLKYLDEWNLRRNEIAIHYISRLKDKGYITLPYTSDNRKHVFHLFVIRHKNRAKLIELLNEKNISWGIHYPESLPFLDAYRYKNHTRKDFKNSCELTNEIISLPIYPEISVDAIDMVCDQVLKA